MKLMYLKTTETKTHTANKETVRKKLECKKKWDTTTKSVKDLAKLLTNAGQERNSAQDSKTFDLFLFFYHKTQSK